MTNHEPAVIAESVRSGFVESEFRGHAVVVDPAGRVTRAWGDPDRVIYPRSCNKLVQGTAMVSNGLVLPPELLALVASSHWGEPMHLDAVQRILAEAGLDESHLQTPLSYPIDPDERDEWIRHGRPQARVAMTCSGKHAGMLVTCTVNGWPLDTYRDPGHPLQREITRCIEEFAGEPVAHVGVDGCGAPVLAMSLTGLARSLSRVALGDDGTPAHSVASAMRAHPELVGGRHADPTAFMQAVPGLLAKDGALDVYAAALPDGTGIAVKAEDGGHGARQVALAEILVLLGADPQPLAPLREIPVLGGGRPVGRIASPLQT